MQHEVSTNDIPRSVGRVLDLFEIVLAHGSCNLTTAASEAELTPTTALRHLRALEARGYLARDDAGLFSAGPTIRRIAATIHESSPLERLVTAAKSHLDSLAATTGESCYLAVADQTTATYLATAEGTYPIRHVGWVGQSVPLSSTAVGEALSRPGHPAVRTDAVEPDIAAASIAIEPYEGSRAALSIVGPTQRLVPDPQGRGREDVLAALIEAANGLSADLGLTPPDQGEPPL